MWILDCINSHLFLLKIRLTWEKTVWSTKKKNSLEWFCYYNDSRNDDSSHDGDVDRADFTMNLI